MQPLVGIVQELSAATGSIKKDREGATNALALLSQFAKVAREALLGLPPLLPQASLIPDEVLKGDEASLSSLPEDARTSVVKLKAANAALKEELSLRFVAADEERSALGKALGRSYQSSCAALVEEHAALGEQEKENTRIINTRGDLPPDMAAEYEKKRKAYELLHRATAALAECLDKPMPELVEDAFTRLSNAPAPAPVASTGEDASLQVFEDVESRMFYESLPDIRSMVPAVLLGLPSNAAKGEAEEAESAEEGPSEPLSTPSEDEAAAEEAVSKEEGGEEPGQEQDVVSDPVKEGEGEASAEPASATEGKEGGRSQLDHVLSKLPYCVSRDTCDEISVNFCFSNSKVRSRPCLITFL
jgi:regulator of nonsense transcripts 2